MNIQGPKDHLSLLGMLFNMCCGCKCKKEEKGLPSYDFENGVCCLCLSLYSVL
jgi:hypothetical protein